MMQNIYLILDVSGSMFGEPMQSMLNGVDGLLAAFRSSTEIDFENTYVTVITFSTDTKIVLKDIPLAEFVMPDIKAGGCTNFSRMMDVLLEVVEADHEVEKIDKTPPMAFFFMDGFPTDEEYENAIKRFHEHEWFSYASFAIAGGTEKYFLAKMTSARRVFDLSINPSFQAAITQLPHMSNGGVYNG